MSNHPDEKRDPLDAELRAWFAARQAPPAPGTLRAFTATLGSGARPTTRVRPIAMGWRQGPGNRFAAAATAIAIVVLAGGLLVIAGQAGRVGPTSGPAASPGASRSLGPSSAATPTSSPAAGQSVPSPIDDGGSFGASGLWAVVGDQLDLSTDAGASWVQRTLVAGVALDAASGNVLSSVFVLDASHAWTASPGPGSTVPYDGQGPQFDHLHVVISRTTDGGMTWQSVELPGDWGGTQPVLVFADDQHGFLVLSGLRGGPASTVFGSTDGGATWQHVGGADSRGSDSLGSVVGTSDATTVWAGNEGDAGPVARPILDVSRDGGRTWADARLPGLVGDIYVNDTLVAPPVFAGSDGAVAVNAASTDNPPDVRFYHTSDGGRTWLLAARMPFDETGPGGVAVIDPRHFVVIDSRSGVVQASSDGGATWQQSTSSGLGAALRLRFWNPIQGAAIVLEGNGAAHNAGLLRTSDGGQTWTPVTLTAAPSPTTAVSLPPTCLASALQVRGGSIGGGTGTAHAEILFTNVGSSPCSLSGQPKTVEFLTANGIPLALMPTGAQPDPVPPATLAPGVRDAASVAYGWSNWCGKAPGSLRVRVELPEGGSVTGPFDGPPEGNYVPRCDNPSGGSALELLWGFANPTP
jgi:photosystem II stability/assembly factor-like uncharacterized protein